MEEKKEFKAEDVKNSYMPRRHRVEFQVGSGRRRRKVSFLAR